MNIYATPIIDTTKFITLTDGRRLYYAEYGADDGNPVIYFHGFPGSRLEVQRYNQIALSNNCRLIAVDRPGMGLSTIDKKRSILSTVNDIINLADKLGITKFSIISHSGGSPFVAACAYAIPERLTGAAIVSGMSPFENPKAHIGMVREQLVASKLVKKFPLLAIPMMWITRMMLRKSDKLLDKMIKPLPEVDQAIFLDSDTRKELVSCTLEAFRNGIKGAAFEMRLLLSPWGFKLENIEFPISVWHGAKDTQVPLSNGRLNASLIQNATIHICENEGHHSIMRNYFEEILSKLADN